MNDYIEQDGYRVHKTAFIGPKVQLFPGVVVEEGCHIDGCVGIRSGSIVNKNTKIFDSEIYDDVTIGESATIRSTIVGPKAKIEDYVKILNSRVGPRCHIERFVYIGEGCHIYSGVKINNNVQIGEGTRIGANATIHATTPKHAAVEDGETLNFRPLVVLCSPWTVTQSGYNLVTIGCQCHTVDEWRRKFDVIAETYSVTGKQKEMYRAAIECCAAYNPYKEPK